MEEMQSPEKFLTDEIKNLLKVEDSKPKIVSKPENEIDFLKQGSEFWSKMGSELVKSYERGEVISNYNSVSEFDHLNIFHSLTRIFYEVIREELVKKEINSATIKECFMVIDSSFKILSQQIENEFSAIQKDKEEPAYTIDVDLLFSGINGFINSYLQRKTVE